jgi:DNA-binding MarR family transcriptional regulator
MDTLQTETGSAESQRLSPEAFQQQLGEIAKTWLRHQESGLELRHRTGILLNSHLGSPENRQNRGEQVVKDVAERLKTTASDISRMRWFGHLFKTPSDLTTKHPGVTTWSAFKALLPTIKPKGETKSTPLSGAASTKTKELRVVRRSLQALSDKVKQVTENLSEADRNELVEKLQEILKAISDRLKIRVEVKQMSVEETSPDTLKD